MIFISSSTRLFFEGMARIPNVSFIKTTGSRNCSFWVALGRPTGHQDLNILGHGAEVGGQFLEKLTFFDVAGQSADDFAILCLNEQLFELRAHVFHS